MLLICLLMSLAGPQDHSGIALKSLFCSSPDTEALEVREPSLYAANQQEHHHGHKHMHTLWLASCRSHILCSHTVLPYLSHTVLHALQYSTSHSLTHKRIQKTLTLNLRRLQFKIFHFVSVLHTAALYFILQRPANGLLWLHWRSVIAEWRCFPETFSFIINVFAK